MTYYGNSPAQIEIDGLVFNRDDSDQIVAFTEIDGWHNGPGVEVDQAQRVASHGQFAQDGHRTGRHITLTGWVNSSSRAPVLAGVQALNSILADGGFAPFTVRDDNEGTLTASVQLLDRPEIVWDHPLLARFQLQLLAPDPYRYGTMASASTGFASEPEGIGFVWPGFPDGVALWSEAGTFYAWMGSAHGSASTKKVDGVELDRNLRTNPDSVLGPAFSANSGSDTPVQSTDHADALAAYSTKCNRGSGSSVGIAAEQIDGEVGDRTAGYVFKMSYDIWVPSDAVGTYGTRIVGAGSVENPAATAVTTDVRDDWDRVQTQATDVGSGAVNWQVLGGSSASDVYVRRLKLTYGPADHEHGAYFDGDTPDVPGTPTPGSLGIATVSNPGTAPSRPVFRVAGPAPDAGLRITEVGTGSTIEFLSAVPSGSQLVIDASSATAVIDGVADRSGDVVLSGSWPSVPTAGTREYLFQSLGDYSTSVLTVEAVATYY